MRVIRNCAVVNENRVIGIESVDRIPRDGAAGRRNLIARRIVGWPGRGTKLAKGERIGMIRFGSRVELFSAMDCESWSRWAIPLQEAIMSCRRR